MYKYGYYDYSVFGMLDCLLVTKFYEKLEILFKFSYYGM